MGLKGLMSLNGLIRPSKGLSKVLMGSSKHSRALLEFLNVRNNAMIGLNQTLKGLM